MKSDFFIISLTDRFHFVNSCADMLMHIYIENMQYGRCGGFGAEFSGKSEQLKGVLG